MNTASLLPVLAAALVSCAAPAPPTVRCDLLIAGGTVVDGTGAAGVRADVAVRGDRITAVVAPGGARFEAKRILDATGLVVTPGFIDVHAHGDPLRSPEFRNFTAMGVTTIFLGLDGSSPADGDLGQWLDAVGRRRPAVNVGSFVGHGTVRRGAGIGAGDDPTSEQIADMAERVAAALDAGAFGLSTGLEYTPGRLARMDELVAIARPVAARGAVVASHVRSEDDDAIEAAVDELLTQCRTAGAAAHLSHAKIVYAHDPSRADAVLALLAAARADGIRATADVYPYTASFTGLSILFPDWALPPHEYAVVAADRRDDLLAHLRARVTARNGPGATLFGSGPYPGRTLAEVAAARGVPFEDVLLELGPGGASAAYFVMDDAVMERFLIDPAVMVASDGSPTMRHPRGHGTFARVIDEHVVGRGALTLEDAVRKMTSLPADTVGIRDRGRITPGARADLLAFDPGEVEARATFPEPFLRAVGFRHVLVNGTPVVADGRPTGHRPGHALRRGR